MARRVPPRPKRRPMPAATVRAVLTEAGFMCASPRCRHMLTLEIHHIEEVKEGGGNEPHNLLALCPNCHSAFTRGKIPRSAVEAWKQMLLVVNNGLDRDSLDLLLFLHRQEAPMRAEEAQWAALRAAFNDAMDRWVARHPHEEQPGRSLADFGHAFYRSEECAALPPMPGRNAELIQVSGDGLLRLARLIMAGLADQGTVDYRGDARLNTWTPRLTATGMALADAWLAGDAGAVRALLRGASEPGQS